MKILWPIKWTWGLLPPNDNLLQQLNEQLALLQVFHNTHTAANTAAGIDTRQLIERVVALKKDIVPLDATQEETLPGYASWLQFGETIHQLGRALEDTGAEPVFANHPFSSVNEKIFTAEQPGNLLDSLLKQLKNLLEEINQVITTLKIAPEHTHLLQQVKSWCRMPCCCIRWQKMISWIW